MALISKASKVRPTLPTVLALHLKKLRRRSRTGTVLTLVDLFPLEILKQLRHVEYTVYTVRSTDALDQSDPGDVNPSLSFNLARGNIFFFRYATDFERFSTTELETDDNVRKYSVSGATIVIHSRQHDESINKYIKDGILVVLQSGLYQANFQRDLQRRHVSDLRAAIQRSKGNFGLPHIVSFLADKGLDCALLHMPNVRSVQVDVFSSSPAALRDVFLAIDRERPDSPSKGRFVTVGTGESYGGRRLIDAAKWGKPIIFGLEANNAINHILFVPVARPYLTPQGRQDGKSIVCRDIICLSLPSLNRKQVAEVQDYVEYFAYHRFTQRRFETVNLIYNSLRSLRESRQAVLPLSRSELLKRLASFAQEHLDAVLYTTAAHSITLRLFDPTRRALVRVAMASFGDGLSDVTDINEIDTERCRHTSVNAYTFTDAGEKHPNVYIPRIPEGYFEAASESSKSNVPNCIPKEYAKTGLHSILSNRRDTRCEICFPILVGDVCIGTMNCEAPIYHGFDEDISYLTTVKEGFEVFLSDVMSRFDLTWLLQQGWRADAVHELWQYIETDFFDCKTASLLKRLFPDPRTTTDFATRTLGWFCEQVTNWTRQRYETASPDAILALLKFRLPPDFPASALFLETLYFISRNLIQNAVLHTAISGSVLYFDLIKLRRGSAVQVHFRTRSVLQPISPETIDRLCLSPVTDRLGRKRYGLFIVGLLARLLGGTAQAVYSRDTAELAIKVIVPIREIVQ